MSAFTPGPWRIVIDGTCSAARPHIVSADYDAGSYPIAELKSCFLEKSTRGFPRTYDEKPGRFKKTDDHDEVIANARLIVAAPDLHEALSMFVACVENSQTSTWEAYKAARVALSKVKG